MSGILCLVPIVAEFFSACATPGPIATGYVEGEFLLIAPVEIAQVDQVNVRRGEEVAMGDSLVVMERRDAEISLAQAASALLAAESQLADLRQARRAEEIRVIEAELASAEAQLREATIDLQRAADLLSRGAAPQSRVDDAQTRVDVASARVAEVEANLAVARLPARAHRIAAAEAAVEQARASRDAAAWRLQKRELAAPANGTVFEILRRPGEIAGPQAPVLSLLPEGGILLRLYVPEAQVASIAEGDRLTVGCDGCPPDTTAQVTFVADEPEFTPPVIYSLENRQKLVYLVEARPDADAAILKPGQIVDVRLKADP